MSVRAYKVIEIKTEKDPTFNLWHDEELMALLEPYGTNQLNSDGCGLWEFSLEELLDIYKSTEEEPITNDTMEILERIIKEAKKDGYVQFYCS